MSIIIGYIIFSYGFNSGLFADVGADLRGVSGLMWLFSPLTLPYFLWHIYLKD